MGQIYEAIIAFQCGNCTEEHTKVIQVRATSEEDVAYAIHLDGREQGHLNVRAVIRRIEVAA